MFLRPKGEKIWVERRQERARYTVLGEGERPAGAKVQRPLEFKPEPSLDLIFNFPLFDYNNLSSNMISLF